MASPSDQKNELNLFIFMSKTQRYLWRHIHIIVFFMFCNVQDPAPGIAVALYTQPKSFDQIVLLKASKTA